MKSKNVYLLFGFLSMVLTSCQAITCDHKDNDENHLCDLCNIELSQHIDSNNDHVCDFCSKAISEHIDLDCDHWCDLCHLQISEHIDNENNHYCDFCEDKCSSCWDNNIDSHCDICGGHVDLPEWVHQMPTISIETENHVSIDSKEVYVPAKISCDNCDNKDYEFSDVAAGVRGRGNSTWTAPKKPYRIKFDKKQKMFGSSYKAKSWTLLANYFDYSLVRNYVFYKLASQLDDTPFAPCFQFVELFLNGQYEGVYLLSDQVQVGDGRVEIDEDFEVDGNTGYLLEMNPRIIDENTTENVEYFYGSDGIVYEIKSPDVEDENYLNNPRIYVDFIKNCIDSAYNQLAQKADWNNITEIIDINTFADGYVVGELSKNTDIMFLSTYLQKDKNGKLAFGPVWDFDTGAGNSNYEPGNLKECPPIGLWANIGWFGLLLQYDEFVDIVANKLVKYQLIIESLIAELDVEDENSLYGKYGKTFERNFVRWQILGTQVWQITEELLELKSNKEHVNFLKNWLTARNEFLLETYPVEE